MSDVSRPERPSSNPPRLRGYNVPLNEAHQLKTSSPFQCSVRLNLSPIERFFPFFLSSFLALSPMDHHQTSFLLHFETHYFSLQTENFPLSLAEYVRESSGICEKNYYVRSDIPIHFLNFRISWCQFDKSVVGISTGFFFFTNKHGITYREVDISTMNQPSRAFQLRVIPRRGDNTGFPSPNLVASDRELIIVSSLNPTRSARNFF